MNKITNVLNDNYEPISYSKNYFEQIILEKDKEIERLNKECDTYMKIATKRENIIDELEKWLNYEIYCDFNKEMTKGYQDTLDKLKELKEGKNE